MPAIAEMLVMLTNPACYETLKLFWIHSFQNMVSTVHLLEVFIELYHLYWKEINANLLVFNLTKEWSASAYQCNSACVSSLTWICVNVQSRIRK